MNKEDVKFDVLFDAAITFTDLKGMRKAQRANALGQTLSIPGNKITYLLVIRTEDGGVFLNAPAVFPTEQACDQAVKEWFDAGNKLRHTVVTNDKLGQILLLDFEFIKAKAKTRKAKEVINHVKELVERHRLSLN